MIQAVRHIKKDFARSQFLGGPALPQYSLVGLRDSHRRLVGNRKPKSFSEFKALFLCQLE